MSEPLTPFVRNVPALPVEKIDPNPRPLTQGQLDILARIPVMEKRKPYFIAQLDLDSDEPLACPLDREGGETCESCQ